jgi:hypothetical protein
MTWQSLHDIYSTKVLSPAKQESTEIKLSDVYSEQVVRNNNATSLEPQQKEWRSLSEVYTGVTRNNYINEAKLEIKVDGGNPEVFNLKDIYVRKILGLAYSSNNLLEEKIISWVESGGWRGDAIKRIAEQINSILIEVFPDEIYKGDGIKEIARDILRIMWYKDGGTIFETFVKQAAKGSKDESVDSNLFNLFNIEGLKVLNNNKFLSLLCQINLTEKQVNIGPGEVAVTLFTEAKNALKGDLEVEGMGVIELKGTNGRVGDGKVESKVYNTVISKAVDSVSIKNNQNIFFNEIKQLQNPVSGYPVNRILEFKKVKVTDNLYKILNLLYKSQNFEKILDEKIKVTEKELTERLDRLEPETQVLEDFKNAAKEMIILAYKIYGLKDGKEALNFTTFFTKNVVDEQEKINTLYKYVNHGLTPVIEKTISDAHTNKMPVERIIGAISMVNYQRETDFKYIIFANTLPESIERGSMLCTVIGPFTGNYETDLVFVFSKVNDIDFKSAHDRGGFKAAFTRTLPLPAPDDSATGTKTGNSEPSLGANNPMGVSPTVAQGYTSLPQSDASFKNLPTV